MKQRRQRKIVYALVCAVACMLPGFAFAHPGHAGGGFWEGWSHPFSGLDHVVGMVSMGIWASLASSLRQRAAVLACFLAGMLGGGFIGILGAAPAWVESTLMASVLATGTLLLWAKPCSILVRMLAAAGFAAWHGLAHGLEIPDTAAPLRYVAGFMLATCLLLCLGALMGQWVRRSTGRTRWAGAGVLGLALVALGS